MDPRLQSAGYTSHNRLALIRGGAGYFNKAEKLIDEAKYSVHLQTYIFEADETGIRLSEALVRAAFRKVPVYIVLDGYASGELSQEWLDRWTEVGIHFRWFRPFLKGENYYIGRRMHHKILVVDGVYSLVGGVNVSNRYNDTPEQPAWMDWAVYAEGDVSVALFNRCVEMWPKPLWKKIGAHNQLILESLPPPARECLARVRINDWVRNKHQVSRSYQEMFYRATQEITIMSSYFLPGRVIRRNLSQAAKRGVRIRVILTGSSDVGLSKAAEKHLYPWLLDRKIEIYEYPKTVLHGKIAVYDRQWATVGSYNVNNISAYASVELNVDSLDPGFAATVDDALQKVIQQDCVRITTTRFSERSGWFARLGQLLAYQTIRIILYLFTFYFKQEARIKVRK